MQLAIHIKHTLGNITTSSTEDISLSVSQGLTDTLFSTHNHDIVYNKLILMYRIVC